MGEVDVSSNDPAHPVVPIALSGTCGCMKPGPVIQVSPPTIDFNHVGTPMDRSATVTITNIGGAGLTVTQVRLSAATPSDFALDQVPAANTVLMPGQTATFKASYHGGPTATPSATVTGTVEVLSNDPATSTATVAMSAACLAAFGGGPDGDGDGIPDACDACLYDGPTPPALPNTVSGSGITLSNGQLNGAGNILLGVPAGSTFRASYNWQVTTGPSCGGCPGCITQYYVTADRSPSVSVQGV